jgi:hypothetical protein
MRTLSKVWPQIVPTKRQCTRLLRIFKKIATKPPTDFLIDRGWTNEEQSFPAQRFAAQHMPFINKLRQDTFRDIFPIDPCRTIATKCSSVHMRLAFCSVIACCIDRLNFDCDKLLQLAFGRKKRQYPVNEVRSSPAALRQVKFASPSLSKYSDILETFKHCWGVATRDKPNVFPKCRDSNLQKHFIVRCIKTNRAANYRARVDLLDCADAADDSIAECFRACISKEWASVFLPMLHCGRRRIACSESEEFNYADRHSRSPMLPWLKSK